MVATPSPRPLGYDAAVDLHTAIASMSTVDGDLLRVDQFLNHRVDPAIMAEIATAIADLLRPVQPDLLLTAEAGGMPPALAAGAVLGIPTVYAKKYLGPGERYTFYREVSSPTKGTEYRVEVARRVLEPGLRVAVVDDFLAGGRTAEALGQIAEEAGCAMLGAVFVIEKTFSGGRRRLEARGWPVWSLVAIESLEGGEVHFAP